MGKADSTKQSEITVNSEQSSTSEHPMEQTSVDPKSESQFSSFMSYHEGESSSLCKLLLPVSFLVVHKCIVQHWGML